VTYAATTGPQFGPAAPDQGAEGYVHSYHVGSTVDGPGVRMVVWTTGCPLRCAYCHNPDTWKLRGGTPTAADEVLAQLRGYARFLRTARGGLTISGGEPLVQAPFVTHLFRQARQLGVHTALDTSGFLGDRLADADLESIDLVLLDIKSFLPEVHRRLTGRDVAPTLRFARRLSDLGRPMWVRFVLVPGLTDDPANVAGLAAFVATLRTVERVEVLPFHQMGRYKWERLGLPYTLAGTPEPDEALVERVRGQFRQHDLYVV
jgi:pyruvate formate lyase activating enzyme